MSDNANLLDTMTCGKVGRFLRIHLAESAAPM